MKQRLTALHDTAYHEAGHAVICAAVRLRIRRVTIVPTEDHAGCCEEVFSPDWKGGMSPDGEYLRHLAVLMAGSIAAYLVREQRPRWGHGGGHAGYSMATVEGKRKRVAHASLHSDLAQTADIVLHLEPDDSRKQSRLSNQVWKWTTHEIRARWPQVRSVAESLLEKRTLSGRSVLRIIRQSGRRSGRLSANLSALVRERGLAGERRLRENARKRRQASRTLIVRPFL